MIKIIAPRAVIAGLATLLLSAAPPSRALHLDNAEDLASVAGSPWVIASSMAGGAQAQGSLAAIDARDGTIRRLYPESGVNDTPSDPGVRDCPGMPAADTFKPHGIAYVPKGKTGGRLYVVNHGARESIEFFDVVLTPAPRLHWVGCAIVPPGAFGNGVAAVADGTLYMTNMGRPLDGSAPLSDMGGQVVAWHAGQGWRTVPDSAILAPNGIVATADGSQIYVASWSSSAVFALTPDGKAPRRALRLDFLPDNLRWSDRGTILAVGHRTSIKAVRDCYISPAERCTIPSAMAEIDPARMTVRCTRPVALDMATVALPVGRELWIGTARGDHISREKPCTRHAAYGALQAPVE
jgi:sugar lactone lactonase YvrE